MGNKKVLHALKKLILSKAKIKKGTSTDNIKLGDMGSWAMLFGNIDWDIPELGITVKGTCGEFCQGCFDENNPKCSECYVAKSYMKYTKRNEDDTVGNIITNECSVKLGHAYRTLAMTMFRDELMESLDKQLTRMKKKLLTVRINESGELTGFEDLNLWCKVSKNHPETIFYLYTKNFDTVREALERDIVPKNLFINISIWHEYGIKEYLEFRWHPQIRSFAVVDEEWTKEKYKKHGLIIKAMCPAYDSKGKMNHDQTCASCGICFHALAQETGCYKH